MSSPTSTASSTVDIKWVALPAPLPSRDASFVARTATSALGLPCRRCLLDSLPGEDMVLLSYNPFPPSASDSPYHNKSPIFVHIKDCNRFDGRHLPQTQLNRMMSLRAYDESNMMLDADVADGKTVENVARRLLADDRAKYVNVHNAKHGCYAVTVERA